MQYHCIALKFTFAPIKRTKTCTPAQVEDAPIYLPSVNPGFLSSPVNEAYYYFI
jgi:hypothetical protein